MHTRTHTHYDVSMRKLMRCLILTLFLATTVAAIFKFAIFHKINRRVSIILLSTLCHKKIPNIFSCNFSNLVRILNFNVVIFDKST